MSLTRSENLFEAFCQTKRIRCVRVDTGNSRTPDYEIFIPRRKVIVEVKEIAPNPEERRARKGEFVVISTTPGQRVRGKISNAVPQIKARAKGRFPGLLVLMDTGFWAEHTSPYNIRVAMHGFETLIFAVPNDPGHSPYAVDKKFGSSRKMTPTSNTSVSAIAVIGQLRESVDFRVYHNPYAAIPLLPEAIRRYHIPQYVLASQVPGSIPDWMQL